MSLFDLSLKRRPRFFGSPTAARHAVNVHPQFEVLEDRTCMSVATPTGLQLTALSSTQVKLTWTNPAGSLGTRILFWNGTTTNTIAQVAKGVSTFTATNLKPNTTQWFSVQAFDASTNAQGSWVAILTPPDAITVPTNLHVASTTQTQVTLAWANGTGVTGYRIYGWDGTKAVLLGTTTPSVPAFTVNNLTPGTNYYFYVQAFNSTNSVNTDWVTATTTATSITAPSNLKTSVLGPGTIGLSWKDSAGETGYRVYQWDGNSARRHPDHHACRQHHRLPGDRTHAWPDVLVLRASVQRDRQRQHWLGQRVHDGRRPARTADAAGRDAEQPQQRALDVGRTRPRRRLSHLRLDGHGVVADRHRSRRPASVPGDRPHDRPDRLVHGPVVHGQQLRDRLQQRGLRQPVTRSRAPPENARPRSSASLNRQRRCPGIADPSSTGSPIEATAKRGLSEVELRGLLFAIACSVRILTISSLFRRSIMADAMLAHNVFFTLHDSSDAARAKLVAACKKYLTDHPGIAFFACGVRATEYQRPVNDGEFDVGLHIVFRTKADHDAYQVAPRHDQFIAENKDGWKKVRVFDSLV